MALTRRNRLVELVTAHGFILREDDPYRWICFGGDPVLPNKSLDTEGVVIAIGTVLEILSPVLRTGWAVADVEMVHRMALQKVDGGSSPLTEDRFRSHAVQQHEASHRESV